MTNTEYIAFGNTEQSKSILISFPDHPIIDMYLFIMLQNCEHFTWELCVFYSGYLYLIFVYALKEDAFNLIASANKGIIFYSVLF